MESRAPPALPPGLPALASPHSLPKCRSQQFPFGSQCGSPTTGKEGSWGERGPWSLTGLSPRPQLCRPLGREVPPEPTVVMHSPSSLPRALLRE